MNFLSIAAVVVHHRSCSTLGATVSRLVGEGLIPSNILVVDNSEEPAQAALLEQSLPSGVRIIFISNEGYGAAVNTGAAWHAEHTSATDYLLVSTHEALPEPGALKALAALLDRQPKTAVVGPALVTGEQADQIWSLGGYFSNFLGLPRHHSHLAARDELAEAVARRVRWLDGAFLLFRRDILDRHHVDEAYFLYMEETDHQLGLQRQGWDVHLEPAAVVWQSSGGTPSFYQTRNIQLFQAKNGSRLQSMLAAPYIIITALARDLLKGRGLVNLKPLVSGWTAGRNLLRSRAKNNVISIVNPLGGALAHYTEALASTLIAAGAEVRVCSVQEPSLSGQSRGRWLLNYFRLLTGVSRSPAIEQKRVLVVWPVLGFLDLLLVRLLCGATASVVYHDPKPLVRAVGSDPLTARFVASLPSMPDIIVHSQAAADAMKSLGFKDPLHLLAHPMLRPGTAMPLPEGTPEKPVVRVLGQYKRDRDLGALEALAAHVGDDMVLEIVGRGWPNLEGWKVDSRFVPEGELDKLVLNSDAIVIPYLRFYQSGIAIRALESKTPIVGRAATSLADLYGGNSKLLVHAESETGHVDDRSWVAAVQYAVTQGQIDAAEAAANYYAAALSDWRSWHNQPPTTRGR